MAQIFVGLELNPTVGDWFDTDTTLDDIHAVMQPLARANHCEEYGIMDREDVPDLLHLSDWDDFCDAVSRMDEDRQEAFVYWVDSVGGDQTWHSRVEEFDSAFYGLFDKPEEALDQYLIEGGYQDLIEQLPHFAQSCIRFDRADITAPDSPFSGWYRLSNGKAVVFLEV